MAFGVELDKRAYKLRLARYKALAEAVASFVKKNEPDGHRFALLDVGVGRGRSMWYIDAEGVSTASISTGSSFTSICSTALKHLSVGSYPSAISKKDCLLKKILSILYSVNKSSNI